MKKSSKREPTERKEVHKKRPDELAREASLESKAARSAEAKKSILYCFEVGITKITDACNYAGVSQDWYADHIKKDPEFVRAIETAKAKRQMLALARITKAGETSWQAHAWFLERVHSDQYALKQKIESDGIDRSPLIINVTPAGPSSLSVQTQGKETDATHKPKGD